uniref:CARD domain-containing protein n=1 Tax=Oreochromis niloticus TaxID=8128 RepID=A0A669CXF6_ORENI
MYNPTQNKTARASAQATQYALQATQDALQALQETQKKRDALRSRLDVYHSLLARQDALRARQDALQTRRDALKATRDALQETRDTLNRRKWSKQENTGWLVPNTGTITCNTALTAKSEKAVFDHDYHLKSETTSSPSSTVWEVPTTPCKTDQYDVHNPTMEKTATNEEVNKKQTQTETAGLLSDTCAPFLDESAAGSSSLNSESEEIIKHNNMESVLDDDYKLQGKSAPLSAYPLFHFSSYFSGPWMTSCLLPCSHSMVSLSKVPRANNNFTQVNSSPDMLLKVFTPVINDDFDDETCLFQCSCPGLYQCSVTGLVFVMQGGGDVVYRTVPWNRKLLAQHHKKPAGPLFDIKCQQQSVCQLHLPHCELISTGGGRSLQVAHVNDEGIEFITPHRITESHVVINITGFSGYGNVKDEDSPPDPVQALVLLFYKPPVDPDLRSFLSVLLLPRNIVIRDVQRTRRKLNGDERYIDTSPHCKLHPKQVYTLSTVPEDDLIKVQPKEADFDDEYHDSYFTSFQVILRRILTDVNLSLKDESSSTCVWERDVCLFSPTVGTLNRPPSQRLFYTRSCFIEGISGPVLSSLIDKLLEKTVITDAEREEADTMKNKREKARFVIDTVRSKGDAASSELINFLRENDHILCEHLRLN